MTKKTESPQPEIEAIYAALAPLGDNEPDPDAVGKFRKAVELARQARDLALVAVK